ncbi:hypothetical protein [Mycolicibacterium llatzerense]|uniref:Transglycosylase SLT domain-containing protein n=1 Tax=Mycolicibacterium llatzerense TaxID=280871 RepID=A0A0D1K086_9MYCO|nr:hypothetical protein [Mycolicibacterium llatzerense]KIU18324.1 hypothetical protein TL10_02420 [Mycolicibacterium llatzerense]
MATYDAGDASINVRPSLSGFTTELRAELQKINASMGVEIRPDLSGFRDELRTKLEAIQATVGVGIDADLATARAHLAEWRQLEESRPLTIPVHVDTTVASAQLATWRETHSHHTIHVTTTGLGALGGGGGGGGGGLSALKLNLGALSVGSLPAIATALAQVAGSLQQVAQAGLAVPGIMGGAAASIGTLVVGLSGVKDAYDAVTKASESAGEDQAAQAKAATSAHQQLRNAVVDDAQAHKDLSQAYQDAKQRLTDLNIEQRGGVISEAQAINDAKKARRDLAQGRFKDALDFQDAQLRVAAADQRVVESHQRNINLQQKVSQENAKGVEQSDEVVSAKERVVRADQQVANSQQAVADASTKASAAEKAAAQEMAKLSPNAQAFLKTVIALKPEFSALKNTVQDNMFAGLSDGLKNLVSADLPNLKQGMGGIATAWNQNIKQLFTSLGSDQSRGLLDRILGNTAEAQERFTKAIDPIIHALGTLTAGSSDALPRLADGIGKVAERFDRFITAADSDGSLQRWINEGLTAMTNLGNTVLNLVTSFTAVTKAAGGGAGLLGTVEQLTGRMSAFLNSDEGQEKLKNFFREGKEQLEKWWGVLQKVPGALQGLYEGAKAWTDVLLPPLKDITGFLKDHPTLVKTVAEAFLAWKTVEFAGGILGQLGRISGAIGTKGNKGSLLGKIALMAAALGALDALTGDDNGGDPNNPTNPNPQKTANNVLAGAGAGAWFGPWGAAVGAAGGAVKGVYDDATREKTPQEKQQEAEIPGLINSLPKGADGKPMDPREMANLYAIQTLADQGDLRMKWVLEGHSDYVRIKRYAWLGQHPEVANEGFKPPQGYATGGPTPSGKGDGPTGGFISELHSDEFVANRRGRTVLGDEFLHAANMGVVDIGRLPGFEPGGYIDPNGNAIHSGTGAAPGPADGGASPVGGGGLPGIANSFLGGLGVPLGGLFGGQQSAGATPAGGAGLAGLFAAGDDSQKQDAWMQQTGDWLGTWAGSTLAKFGGELYTGALRFFGLENSILSPSNQWFQAGVKSLGIFNNNAGGAYGDQQLGTEYKTLADGTVLPLTTYGTSGTPNSTGSNVLNQLSQASSLGGANVSYTPEFLASKGIAPLFARTLDKDGNSVAQIPSWATQLAGAFGLSATSHSDSTLHGNKTGGWAFDFSGKPEDEQRFADFIQSNLSGQTLQAIWQNPGTGQQLGIAGGQTLGRDQYYTTKGGAYADHTDHVHWATDVAPNLWDANGKSLVPGVPNMAGAPAQAGSAASDIGIGNTASWFASLAKSSGAAPGTLPSGVSGGGRGAGLNLALAAQGRKAGKTGGAERWRPAVRAALAKYGPLFGISNYAAWEDAMVRQIQTESNGDPSADNPNDSNGNGGSQHVSGIAQFLKSTFDSNNITGGSYTDPYAQIAAMIPYVARKYGMNAIGGPNFIGEGHGYSDGGVLPGYSPGKDNMSVPMSGGEGVLIPEAVRGLGGPAAVYAINSQFRSGLSRKGYADGGVYPLGYQPPKPVVPQLPEVRKLDPGRGAAQVPSAPVTPLPAPVATAPTPAPTPPPAPAGADQGPAPDQQKPTQPVIAGAPSSQSHLLPAVQKGITEGASTLGNIAATAASMGAGAAGGAGGAGAGTLIQGMFNLGGKAVSGAANVFASALVGNLGDNTTAGAYGAPVLSTPPQPAQPIDNRTMFGDVQVGDPRQFVEEMALYEQQRSQAQEGYVR